MGTGVPIDHAGAVPTVPTEVPFVTGQVEVLRSIALGAPLAEVLEQLVRTIESAAPGMRASVLLLDGDGVHLRHGAAPSLPDRYNAAIDGLTIGPAVGSCGTAAYLDEATIVTDIGTDPRWADFRELADDIGVRACWSTPIHSHRDEVLGTFAMYYDDVREPGAAEERLISIATDLASIAITRDRGLALEATARELQLSADHVDALLGLNRAAIVINSRATLDEMLATITEQACSIVGTHQGSTSLTEPGTGHDEGYPQLAISVWLSDKYAAWRGYTAPSRGAATYRLVCDDNRVVRMTHAELTAHPAWANFGQEADRHPPMNGWLAAPLVASDGSNLGIIQLSDKVHGEFDDADEALLVQLAQMASVAVEQERLRELAADRERQQLREELLAGLSHDMQTPLATISGLVAWLDQHLALRPSTDDALGDRDADDDRLPRTLEILDRQTDHLAGLVQQFLDYSRLEAGRHLPVGGDPVDLAVPIERAVALHGHRHAIRVEAPEDPIAVPTDPLRLQQVVSNLLSNAVRFARGPIVVRTEHRDGEVHLHVDDDGPGVAPDDREAIFDRFYRGREASGTPGTGLGLYVSREVARALGGDLIAAVSPQGGARITVRVPVTRTAAAGGPTP
jgi:signal transduction histidine kinase